MSENIIIFAYYYFNQFKTQPKMATTQKLIKTTFDLLTEHMQDPLINLYNRWQDEKQYEDFKDYQKVLQEIFNTKIKGKDTQCTLTFTKATSRPFGIQFWLRNNNVKELQKLSYEMNVTPTTFNTVLKNIPA